MRGRSGRSQIQDKPKARIENSIGLIRSMKEISGFSAEINVDVPEVDVMDDLLSSVIRNIILNAIVHNEDVVKISISARRINGGVEIRIADNG